MSQQFKRAIVTSFSGTLQGFPKPEQRFTLPSKLFQKRSVQQGLSKTTSPQQHQRI